MQEDLKNNKNKTQIKKNRTTKKSQNTSKIDIFNPKNFNINEKNNQYIKRKRNRCLKYKKRYFNDENISALHKKQSLQDSISNNEIWTNNHQTDEFFKEDILSGINWKKFKTFLPTKIMAQIKSYALKFFYKMKSCKDDSLGIDFTLNSINNIKDMIMQIESRYPNYYDIFLVL